MSEEIQVGATVADRRTGRVIGQVDSVHRDNGAPHAIVSWSPQHYPWARTDARGRRGQAFRLDILTTTSPKGA